jgi:hypothetical protein
MSRSLPQKDAKLASFRISEDRFTFADSSHAGPMLSILLFSRCQIYGVKVSQAPASPSEYPDVRLPCFQGLTDRSSDLLNTPKIPEIPSETLACENPDVLPQKSVTNFNQVNPLDGAHS